MDCLLSIIKKIRAQCPVVKLSDLKKACDALIGTSLLSALLWGLLMHSDLGLTFFLSLINSLCYSQVQHCPKRRCI